MAYLLPFRPWLSPDLRVFGFEAPRRLRILVVGRLLSCTSTPPQRLSSYAPPAYPRLMPTMSHSRQAPRYVPSAPQRLRTREPLFSPPCEGVPPALPCQREVPLLGFGYPFSGLQFPDPWKRLSAPNVHGLRPSEPCSDLMVGNRFPGPLPLPRFPKRPVGLLPAPQRLDPTRPAVPLVASRVFSPGRGQDALLGFRTSRVLPSLDRSRASLPTLTLPPFALHDLTIVQARDHRVCSPNGLALSLRRGRRPVWPSPPIASPHLLRSEPAADYFFISERLQPSRAKSHPS